MTNIKELVKVFDGELYDLCYQLVNDNENMEDIFQYACENLLAPPENKTIKIKSYFSPAEIDEYESVFRDSVSGMLSSTVKKCDYGFILPEDFYRTLWQGYQANFTTKKELAFAFYCTLIDAKIPYRYLGKPLNMDNEMYKELLEKNKSSIDKIKYISKTKFRQKTEKASLVLHCLDEIESYESKAVVLSRAFDLLSTRLTPENFDIDDFIRQIDKI